MHDFLIALGLLATQTGCRPSDLIEWGDTEDWQERLLFDMHVVKLLMDKSNNDENVIVSW